MTTALRLDLPRLAIAHPESLAPLTKIDGLDGPEPFDLWPDQSSLIRTILSEKRVLVLKARQLGVTWTLALVALWWALAHPGKTVLIVSIGEREAGDVLRRIRRLYDSLPSSVRAAFPVGVMNATRLEIAHEAATATIISLPSSSTAGRGQTVDLLIGDERPMWPHPDEQEASLFPAAAHGTIVMGGTANGHDTFCDRWMESPANGWTQVFIGALSDPRHDREWVYRQRSSLGDLGPQEYPFTASEAFRASGRCVFDQDALQDLLDHSCRPPDARVELRKTAATIQAEPIVDGPWSVWQWPQAGRAYVIAADVCGGGGGSDFSAAAVYDAESWDQVASYHGRPEPDQFARELARAGWLWKGPAGPALLVPEANNHGQAVVALLREWRYPRVYRSESFDQRSQRTTEQLGWLTTTKSRQQALDTLKAGVRQGSLGIRDQAAIGEMLRFIDKDGREEADAGAHDDRVITHAIAAAVLAHSRTKTAPSPAKPAAPYRPRVSSRTGY